MCCHIYKEPQFLKDVHIIHNGSATIYHFDNPFEFTIVIPKKLSLSQRFNNFFKRLEAK